MKTSDFDYDLPKKFIAQNPMIPRDRSKLLVYDSCHDKVFHKHFFEIGEFLRAGDVIVVNRSKVIPSRINFDGKEIFLLKKISECRYQVLVRPGKYFKKGCEFVLNDNVSVRVISVENDGTRIVEFKPFENLDEKLQKLGRAPFPPYITETDADFSQYQTVYAKELGSVAAPTAGLHFTHELLEKLRKSGIFVEELILHVGLGTFLPVTEENISDHIMHKEEFVFSVENARRLNSAKKEKRRIVGVGTTSVRVLENCFENEFVAKTGETDIFIYPGKHKWKAVDALVTNFHLPKSTLIMLVASFLEHKGAADPIEKILKLYEIAKSKNYRFYSFGDAMMII